MQVLLESDKEISMFSNAEISSTPLEELALSKDNDYVFAMATDQVSREMALQFLSPFF